MIWYTQLIMMFGYIMSSIDAEIARKERDNIQHQVRRMDDAVRQEQNKRNRVCRHKKGLLDPGFRDAELERLKKYKQVMVNTQERKEKNNENSKLRCAQRRKDFAQYQNRQQLQDEEPKTMDTMIKLNTYHADRCDKAASKDWI